MLDKDKFYTAKEVSNILKYKVITIYRLIKAGKLKAKKIGKEWRIKGEDLENLLFECKRREI